MNLAHFDKFKDYYIFLGIAALLYVIYFSTKKAINKSRMKNDQKRRAISNLGTTYIFIIFVSFLVLWARELYQFVLSIAAIGAGLAIAFKEFFLCIAGSFYRTFAHPFSVGDRIQLEEIRGDVVSIGLLATQILEVGPKNYTHQFTGRMLSIPNSMFITHTVFNETDNVHDDDDEFALHVFTVPIKNNAQWYRHRDIILACAQESCDQYIKPANEYFTKIAKKRHVDIPWVEPRINIKIERPEQIELVVRVTVPVALKGTTEQAIIKEYLKRIYQDA